MISIVQSEVLGIAIDRGVDVDALKLVETVYVEVEVLGSSKSIVAFHIAVSKENELRGTNALESLGLEVRIPEKDDGEMCKSEDEGK
ncbi:unnamed protein product [Strongylus vulgaris]|uniref:Uncharacterized protein n=1 Tax=Strongylus vulgaris TaxID=40348 RepID=A0A3P7J1M2_STRVU|nr:unnamed protein product [Strongylus vulgaris]